MPAHLGLHIYPCDSMAMTAEAGKATEVLPVPRRLEADLNAGELDRAWDAHRPGSASISMSSFRWARYVSWTVFSTEKAGGPKDVAMAYG